MPGFAQHFYPKYCVVTKSAFVYYKNKWSAYHSKSKPLITILLSDIQLAQRIQVTIPEEKQVMAQQKRTKTPVDFNSIPNFPKFQLEVFLKEGGTVTVQGDDLQVEDEYEESVPELEDERMPLAKPEETKKFAPAGDIEEPGIAVVPPSDSASVQPAKEEPEKQYFQSDYLVASRLTSGDQDVIFTFLFCCGVFPCFRK